VVPFTDRTDYVSAISNNFAYVTAVEKLMGIRVPERAEFLRVMTAELLRIQSHLLWYAAAGLDLGALSPFFYAFREREEIYSIMEEISGARMTFNYFKIGGFLQDVPASFFDRVRKFVGHAGKKFDEYQDLLIDNVIFVNRTRGVGILKPETALDYGVTGPVLRASGPAYDLRKCDPYSVYPRFDFGVPTGKIGDTLDRSQIRMDEMRQSLRILEQALDLIPAGPVMEKVPKTIKPPPGEVYSRVEGPRGVTGFYVVSDGTEKPYRSKFRTASFSNLSVMPEIVKGILIADLVAVLGSFDFVVPEIDR
jgi:NADH-quinone oxidoreductase subunit D